MESFKKLGQSQTIDYSAMSHRGETSSVRRVFYSENFKKGPTIIKMYLAHLVLLVPAEIRNAVLLKQLAVILLGNFFFPLKEVRS